MIANKKGITFRQMLEGEDFFYGAELVTTRGISVPGQHSKLVELGNALAGDARIGWISVTDNPGGNPMMPPDWLGHILASQQVQIVIHMTCKDLNRNGLESSAWRYADEGFENILAITGDYPSTGYQGLPKPVFDLDSVSLIAMLKAMNDGLQVPGRKGNFETLPRTNFFIGCAISPFKRHERELMPQYFKLAKKIRCGAQWVVPQLGFDMRKFHEIKLFMDWAKVKAPVVGNVYLLNKTVAGMFNANKVPGCVVSDELNELCKKYGGGADKGSQFFTELAAKQLAVFKGMGFTAGYLAGIGKADTFAKIIDMAEAFGENDWKEFAKEIQFAQKDEFYLFEQDEKTKLGDGARLNQAYLESLKNPPRTKNVTAGYQVARKVHSLAFTPGKGAFATLNRVYTKLDKQKEGLLNRAIYSVERVSKSMGFGCKDCGDCSLPDCAYLCPRASCSKGSRNGPCGGSAGGRCELDDKDCLWARAYERLKYYGESEGMLDGPAVFVDGRLDRTSSWANTFLGKDHHQAGRKALEKKDEPPSPVAESSPSDKVHLASGPANEAGISQPKQEGK